MSLRRVQATNFRCLAAVDFEVDPHYNLIHGANASGKTSILEAVAYLGRGKSFRGASAQELTAHGAREFLLLARVQTEARLAVIGIRNSQDGLEVKVDGRRARNAAALAALLPLQVIDPEVHGLVTAGPERRRRYIDWMAFHVEPAYASSWRRFRRALKQRNAALREPVARRAMAAWDREFVAAALRVDVMRRGVLELARPGLEATGRALLGTPVAFEYRQGWPAGQGLEAALAAAWDRDRQSGATQAGPQRAELGLLYEQRRAQRIVSRGQQKLLACTLILVASELVQTTLDRPLLLLLDDPAAELDDAALERLMSAVFSLGSQIIATALEPRALRFPRRPALFHVEQGRLTKSG